MKREYNGWKILTTGGFSTIKRFIASRGDKNHWAFRLRDCKKFCDLRDNGGKIELLYLTPLYN